MGFVQAPVRRRCELKDTIRMVGGQSRRSLAVIILLQLQAEAVIILLATSREQKADRVDPEPS